MSKTNYERDFFAEAHQILKNRGYKSYIQHLLPAGKLIGNQWVAKNPTRKDSNAGSFSTNIRTGKWSDFATGDAGNDLIGWTAYLKGITPIGACFFIGVERPNITDKTKPVLELVEAETPQLEEESIPIDPTAAVMALKTPIADEPAEESSSNQANDNNSETSPNLAIPEFTQELIGQKNKAKFKGGTLTLYHYYNSKDVPVACVVRCDFEDEDKPKAFAQYSWNRVSQRWQASWSEQGKPPYNLQEIIANPDKPVMVVEGEEVVETAKQLFPDFILTTSCMGAGSARSTNWSFLKGRDVIIAPDNDRNGAKYAKDLSDILGRVIN